MGILPLRIGSSALSNPIRSVFAPLTPQWQGHSFGVSLKIFSQSPASKRRFGGLGFGQSSKLRNDIEIAINQVFDKMLTRVAARKHSARN